MVRSVSLVSFVVLVCSSSFSMAAPAAEQTDLMELKANISALWSALAELQSEVRESFDIHVAMENHEHQVHHLGHEDTGHDIHHSERHLQHLEKVHGRTVVGPAGIEPHKPHTPDEKEVLRHEHEFHHANASFETEEEHKAHHDEAILKHLEVDHGHGEHNGVHHGKLNKEMTHELEVHYMGQIHDDHAKHHSEHLLKHLEEDDGHGPANDRPKPPPTPKPSRASRTLQAFCEMRQNKALQRIKHDIVGTVVLSQASGEPLKLHVKIKGLRNSGTSLHGFHVHEMAPTEEGNCNQAGSHYNPHGAESHGGPASAVRHIGDFGNVEAIEDKGIDVTITAHIASLSGPNSILNRTLVLHEKEDNLQPTANSGRLLACCVIRPKTI